MSTNYLRRLINGDAPSIEDWHAHLIAFHEHFENATSGPMSLMRSPAGETSYAIVSRRTYELAPAARAVLDIGCGDGLLLRKLKRVYPQPVELTGVDLCQAELDRATAMLDSATFVCCDARETDLGSERYDAIVAHLAIMIAAEPERILQRAKTALRSDGILLLLMEALPLHPVIGGIFGAGVAALQSIHPAFVPSIPKRMNLADDEELARALSDVGFSDVDVEPYLVHGRFTRAEIWSYVQRVYPFGLLETSTREKVHAAVDDAVTRQLEDDGRLDVTMSLRLAIARA
jgi:SAM-dependent methyltransferase